MGIYEKIRRMKKEERTSIMIFFILILLSFLIVIFIKTLSSFYNPANHLSFHTVLEMMSIAIAFSIAIFSWIIFPQTLSSYRLYMGMLFFVIGSIDLLHTLTYDGMPFFIMESSIERSTWFWVIARTIEAVCLFLILRQPDRELEDVNRHLMLFFSIITVVAIGTFVDTQIERLPVLVLADGGTTLLKQIFAYVVIMFHLLVVVIVYRNYKTVGNTASLYIILASTSITISEALFTFHVNGTEFLNFIRPLFKVIAHYYYLKSIYIFSLEKPFREREKVEKQLRESNTQYKKLIETLPDAVVIHKNEKVIFCNKKFCELLGINNRRKVIGLELGKFIHDDYLDEAREQYAMLMEGEHLLSPSYRKYVLFHGEIIDVEVTAIPILYDDKKSILTVIREVTEQKKLQWELERTKQLYQSLFDYNSEASFMIDKNGKLINVNDSTVSLLGYSKEELLHSSFTLYIYKPELNELLKYFNHVLKGNPLTYKTKVVRKNGEVIDVSVNNVPIKVEEDVIGMIGVARNITDQLRAQKKLKASEERYKSLVELSLQGIFVHDKDKILSAIKKHVDCWEQNIVMKL